MGGWCPSGDRGSMGSLQWDVLTLPVTRSQPVTSQAGSAARWLRWYRGVVRCVDAEQ
jgi:hypothetical protein